MADWAGLREGVAVLLWNLLFAATGAVRETVDRLSLPHHPTHHRMHAALWEVEVSSVFCTPEDSVFSWWWDWSG